jgi:TRAP-type mannitol/chloroaromatic compound transport system substrate-binding protein
LKPRSGLAPMTTLHFMVNPEKWDALPSRYKAIFASAAADANTMLIGLFDAGNPKALRRLVASGVQLRPSVLS